MQDSLTGRTHRGYRYNSLIIMPKKTKTDWKTEALGIKRYRPLFTVAP